MTSTRCRENPHLEVLTTLPSKLYGGTSPLSSGGSVYSPNGLEDLPTPFDAHSSFELELRFTEDRGDYVFSIESPYSTNRPSSSDTEWSELRSPQSSECSPRLGNEFDCHISNYGSEQSSPALSKSRSPELPKISPKLPQAPRVTKPIERRRAGSRQSLNKPLPRTLTDLRRKAPTQQDRSYRQPSPVRVTSPETCKQPRSNTSVLSSTSIVLDTILEHDQLDFHHFPITFGSKSSAVRRPASTGPDGFHSVEAFSQYFYGPPPPISVPNYVAAALPATTPLLKGQTHVGVGNPGKLEQLLGRAEAQKLVCMKKAIKPRIAATEHRMYEMI